MGFRWRSDPAEHGYGVLRKLESLRLSPGFEVEPGKCAGHSHPERAKPDEPVEALVRSETNARPRVSVSSGGASRVWVAPHDTLERSRAVVRGSVARRGESCALTRLRVVAREWLGPHG
jgi:hypothetical protein